VDAITRKNLRSGEVGGCYRQEGREKRDGQTRGRPLEGGEYFSQPGKRRPRALNVRVPEKSRGGADLASSTSGGGNVKKRKRRLVARGELSLLELDEGSSKGKSRTEILVA